MSGPREFGALSSNSYANPTPVFQTIGQDGVWSLGEKLRIAVDLIGVSGPELVIEQS